METIEFNSFSIRTFEYLQVEIKSSDGSVVYRVLEEYRDRAINTNSFAAVVKNLGISLVTPARVITKTYTPSDKKNVKSKISNMVTF